MIEVKFYEDVPDERLKFAVILTRHRGQWVFCKHRERESWEVPGGHRDPGETICQTAERELREETGALEFSIRPVCVYGVTGRTRVNETSEETFGKLFLADVTSFGEIHSEIEKILVCDELSGRWTYPESQPKLLQEAVRRGFL